MHGKSVKINRSVLYWTVKYISIVETDIDGVLVNSPFAFAWTMGRHDVLITLAVGDILPG